MTGSAHGAARNARVEVVVGGLVQGVGFRMFVARVAAEHDLTGWVANEPDGSVRCVAEGPRGTLEAFVRKLAAGPPGAVIERFTVAWSEALDGFDRFAIRSGWHGGD
jgi:acylphosphatase